MAKVLVTAVENPDMDGVACAIAYADYLQQTDSTNEYTAAFQGQILAEPRYVCEQLDMHPWSIGENDNFDAFILLDASEPFGLPAVLQPEKVVEVIDHRSFADYDAFPNAKYQVEAVGAAATLVAERFHANHDANLDPKCAALLLAAIFSNTVSFQADTTTQRDVDMRDWLQVQIDQRFQDLSEQMFAYKSDDILQNLKQSLLLDAKDNCNIGLDKPAAIFQLETTKAAELLMREKEMLGLMQVLFPNEPYRFLLIQDILAARTWLLSDSVEVMQALRKTDLQAEETGIPSRLCLPKIIMRKSVTKALLEAGHE